MNRQNRSLIIDFGIIIFSIIIAVFLAKTQIFKNLLTSSQELEFFGSFFAGIFFTSIFTVAPASVVLVEIAQANSVFSVAILGGVGALLGDFIIFRFIRDRLSVDFLFLIKKSKLGKFMAIFHSRIFRWIIPLVGALIIASPLPDEIGLMMMGLSKLRTSLFLIISFFLNSLGILIMGLIARAIQ